MQKSEAYNYLKASLVLSKYSKIDDEAYLTLLEAVKVTIERIDKLEKENYKLKQKLKRRNKKR